MNYLQSISYLNSTVGKGTKKVHDNILKIMNCLGNPHKKFVSIHIAGTNGKGSVASFIEKILIESNIKIGSTTSPHLITERERIKINGEMISERNFAAAMTKIKEIAEKYDLRPTYFELLTMVAFYEFGRNDIDIGIVEVGVGGRLDSTNILNSEIAVITEIGLDHIKYLGNDLKKIAFEKTSIVKKNSNVVIGVNDNELRKYISDLSLKFGGKDIVEVSKDSNKYSVTSIDISGMKIRFKTRKYGDFNVKLNMLGEHQIRNVICGVEAVEFLYNFGYKIEKKNIISALEKNIWPGRFQPISFNPPVILDGAHNGSAATVLVNTIKLIFKNRKVTFIFAIFRNKEYYDVIDIISEVAEKIYITIPPGNRGENPEILKKYIDKLNIESEIIKNPVDALEIAINHSSQDSGIIITGSLYLVGKVYELHMKSII